MGVFIVFNISGMGYRLGRLFALIEKASVQKYGHRLKFYGRYYNTARQHPGVMFPLLLKKHKSDLSRLSKRDRYLLNMIRVNTYLLPSGLTEKELAGFAEGYHNQRFMF